MDQINLPILLAVDASSDICSIGLQINGIVDHINITESKHQALQLIPALEKLLSRNNIALSDIDAYVLSNGPGRFTGLRIATGFLQGLAYSNHKKIITINSLKLLAQQFITENQNNLKEKIWACTKAYSNVYYTDMFAIDGRAGLSSRIGTLTGAVTLDDLTTELKNHRPDNINFIGSGWLNVFPESEIYLTPANAKFIFALANREYHQGNLIEPHKALPEYYVNPYK